jgi:hypothetical protein
MGAAPRYARPFVVVFLATVVVCALAPLNLWPFSNWELFSRLRGPVQTYWEANVLHHGLVSHFTVASHTACAQLLRSATARFGPTTGIRIYHVDRLLSDRIGAEATPADRRLVAKCTAKGVRAPG